LKNIQLHPINDANPAIMWVSIQFRKEVYSKRKNIIPLACEPAHKIDIKAAF